jgi:hypothetical protein
MIELKWGTPKGEDEAPTGDLGPGQSVDYEFTTPATLNHNGKGANITWIAPSNGNTDFDVTVNGKRKFVPAGSSNIVHFGDKGGQMALQPSTTYKGTVAFNSGAPGGLTIKLYS